MTNGACRGCALFAHLVAALLCSSVGAPTAVAHPVRIGRYTEISYGVHRDHPWSADRGSSRREGRLIARVPVRRPARRWRLRLADGRPRGPVIDRSGMLFVGTLAGLSAIGPEGQLRWSLSIGSVPIAPSLAPSGALVVTTRSGLLGLVSVDGVLLRSFDLGAPVRGSPLVLNDGSIVVGTAERELVRLDAELRPVFRIGTTDPIVHGATRLPRGRVAFVMGHSLTLSDLNGHVERNVGLGARASAAPVLAADGTLWVTTLEGDLLALGPTGRLRSRTSLGSRHYDGAAAAVGSDGAFRVPTLREGLICIGAGGTERWRLANEAGFAAPAAIDPSNTTVLVDRAGRVIAVDANGTERWRIALETPSAQAPVVAADGTLYVTTERGELLAFRTP